MTETKSKQLERPTAPMKQKYLQVYRAELKSELGVDNINEVPALEKIVVSVGLGRSKEDKRVMEAAENTLLKITGQKPKETFARQSIASFKLREGQKIGLMVTLRDKRMYEFLDRLINLVLPRLRDFHGVSLKSFDNQGNYSIGLQEQSIFPELSFEETAAAHGMQVILATSSKNPDHAKALLSKFGMPFEKDRR